MHPDNWPRTVDAIAILAQGVPGYRTPAFGRDATGRIFTPACPKCHVAVADKKVWVRAVAASDSEPKVHGNRYEAVVWCNGCLKFTGMRVTKDQDGTLVQGNSWDSRNPKTLTSRSLSAWVHYYVRRWTCAIQQRFSAHT